MSACRSEKPRIKSGFSDSILSNRALMKADTFGLLRASGGRTVYQELPTTRSPSPRRYNVSVVSSVKQTIREGQCESVILITPRGFAPRTPRHALSRAASSARSVRVGSLARSFAGRDLAVARRGRATPRTREPRAAIRQVYFKNAVCERRGGDCAAGGGRRCRAAAEEYAGAKAGPASTA